MKKFIFFVATSTIIGISILLIINTFGCSREYQYTSDIGEENLKKIKNVILIIACSLRADHLSCYGYERKTSPNIDRLAKEGILFKNCFSQAPYTVHSVASIITAKYPRKLFGVSKFKNFLPDQAETFAEIFKEEGFYTLGFMASPWTRKRFNHHQGFDYYFDTSYLPKRYKTPREKWANRLWGKELTSQIIDKLKEIKSKFFLQILYIDTHKPYTPFPPFKGKFTSDKQKGVKVNRYDETILGFDSYIGKLVEALKELDLLDSTLIIIISDHGDGFGKFHKYDTYHGLMLYNTVIKIPLIFYNPNLSRKGVTIENYITSMDVLPTTLDLMGIPYDREKFDGISQKEFFIELVPSEKPERQIFSETNFLKKEMRRSCIIWDQRWKLICNYETKIRNIKIPVYELYDLKNDPNEITNLFNQKKKIAENLVLLLQDWQKENTGKLQKDMIDEGYSIENIDPEIKEQLKALGYIK
jgi:arylsulfatase A-like enzyme